jgi:putative membrane protein
VSSPDGSPDLSATTPAAGARAERPFKRLSPLTPLVRSFILVVAVFASTWDDILRGEIGPIAWILLAFLVGGAVFGTASWLRTKYWIEADELRVDTGVLSRQSRRIRVDRLQGIDIVQPFVARLFGLAELKMDVAGGSAREGSLAFLPLRDAHVLRETLLARRDAVRTDALAAAGAGATVGGPAGRMPEPGPAPELVVARLDLATLLASLLLSPETVLFVLASVALAGVSLALGTLGGVAGGVPVVAGFALTQLRKLSAYYGFVVTRSTDGFQVRRGLFELNAQTVALARVQGVVVTEPWMWRRFGWSRLQVSVAGQAASEGDGKPSASTVMPVAEHAVVASMARTLLSSAGSPDLGAVSTTPPPEPARWVAPVRRRFMSFGAGEDLLVSRGGVLTRRTHAVPHARVQSLRLRQGPWQRRLGLADLHVDSPPGPVKVRARHRDAEEARALLELALDRVHEAQSSAAARP